MEQIARLGYVIPIAVPLGYLFARRGWLPPRRLKLLIVLVIYFFIPALIFYTVWHSELRWGSSGAVALGAAWVIAALAGAVYLLAPRTGTGARERVLPVAFMNTANLGIPINGLLFGRVGVELATMFSIVTTLLHYSCGVYLVSAQGSFWRGVGNVLRAPILYAALFGFLLNGRALPAPAERALHALSLPGIPLMLFLLGFDLVAMTFTGLRTVLKWAGLKYAVGIGAMLLFIFGMRLTGTTAALLLVSAGFPSAVATSIFTRKYEASPAFATGMVMVTTAATVVVIPLLALAGTWLFR